MTNGITGYSPKDLKFNDEARQKLLSGIKKLSSAVSSTLGPKGNTVLIESSTHIGGFTITKDGVTVAKSIDLLDPIENLAVRIVKEAADKTASNAGDGTTTSIVLTEALTSIGSQMLDENPSANKTLVMRHLSTISEEVVEMLKKSNRKISKKKLLDVATISANNDKTIGKIITDVYNEVGRNGIVTVERSETSETYSEVTHGFKISRGYYSSMFINDQKRDECVLEDCMVLVSDAEIHNLLQIENVLKPIVQERKKLLIIAPCSTNVVNTLAANVVKNKLGLCAIEPPSFGYKKHELMSDIAAAVGATFFSEKTGDDLSLISYSDLGHAAKVVVDRQSTVIVNSEYRTDNQELENREKELRIAYQNATKKSDKDFIMSRIAALTGAVGVIFVGGDTDSEQKELYDRVDDAVCAVRSALEEGIVPGGGIALYDISKKIKEEVEDPIEMVIAKRIMAQALKVPLKQILKNAGFNEINAVYPISKPDGHGFNIITEYMGDMIDMGVIDPLKVTRSAFQNAVSVAKTILSTNAIITMARTYETSDDSNR